MNEDRVFILIGWRGVLGGGSVTPRSEAGDWGLLFLLGVLPVVEDVDILQDGLDKGDVDLVDQVEARLLDRLDRASLRPCVSLEWITGDLLGGVYLLLESSMDPVLRV